MLELKEKIKIIKNEYMNYLIFLPEKIQKNIPVLLYLHGIGEEEL